MTERLDRDAMREVDDKFRVSIFFPSALWERVCDRAGRMGASGFVRQAVLEKLDGTRRAGRERSRPTREVTPRLKKGQK